MKAYAGIDLHSTNNYIGIINDKDQRLFKKRLPNVLPPIKTSPSITGTDSPFI